MFVKCIVADPSTGITFLPPQGFAFVASGQYIATFRFALGKSFWQFNPGGLLLRDTNGNQVASFANATPAQFTFGVDSNGQKVINVATPTAPTDGVNKAYVDGVAAPPFPELEARTGAAGPLTDTGFTWTNLLTLSYTLSNAANQLRVAADIAYRAIITNDVQNPVKGCFRLTVDGAEIVTWCKTSTVQGGLSFESTSMTVLSGALAAGAHTIDLDWGTDATSAATESIQVDDAGDFFGNQAVLRVQETAV
ncbi:MAG: hypothetical protein ACHREM_13540 [Polyangiales bacterium]